MIRLKDGRTYVYQYDTNVQLECDENYTEIHCSTRIYGQAISVPVASGLATIPDALLVENNGSLYLYGYIKTGAGGYTVEEKVIPIKKRPKPQKMGFLGHSIIGKAKLGELKLGVK